MIDWVPAAVLDDFLPRWIFKLQDVDEGLPQANLQQGPCGPIFLLIQGWIRFQQSLALVCFLQLLNLRLERSRTRTPTLFFSPRCTLLEDSPQQRPGLRKTDCRVKGSAVKALTKQNIYFVNEQQCIRELAMGNLNLLRLAF